jgi:hypothetical protein
VYLIYPSFLSLDIASLKDGNTTFCRKVGHQSSWPHIPEEWIPFLVIFTKYLVMLLMAVIGGPLSKAMARRRVPDGGTA